MGETSKLLNVELFPDMEDKFDTIEDKRKFIENAHKKLNYEVGPELLSYLHDPKFLPEYDKGFTKLQRYEPSDHMGKVHTLKIHRGDEPPEYIENSSGVLPLQYTKRTLIDTTPLKHHIFKNIYEDFNRNPYIGKSNLPILLKQKYIDRFSNSNSLNNFKDDSNFDNLLNLLHGSGLPESYTSDPRHFKVTWGNPNKLVDFYLERSGDKNASWPANSIRYNGMLRHYGEIYDKATDPFFNEHYQLDDPFSHAFDTFKNNPELHSGHYTPEEIDLVHKLLTQAKEKNAKHFALGINLNFIIDIFSDDEKIGAFKMANGKLYASGDKSTLYQLLSENTGVNYSDIAYNLPNTLSEPFSAKLRTYEAVLPKAKPINPNMYTGDEWVKNLTSTPGYKPVAQGRIDY